MFGRVLVADVYSSNNFMSRQLYGMKLSYEIGSYCLGRGVSWGAWGFNLLQSTLTLSYDFVS